MSTHLLGAAADNIVDCPVVTGQHARGKALYVFRSVTAEYIRQLGHQRIDGFYGHGLCFFSQMGVNTGGGWTAMTQPGLNQAQIDAGFQ